MNADDILNLAKSWISLQYTKRNSDEYESLFWSCEALYDLVRRDPIMAWHIIGIILGIDNSKFLMANLGAGPVEDLLAHHGKNMISIIENASRLDNKVCCLLGYVWKNSMEDQIWDRIVTIAIPESMQN